MKTTACFAWLLVFAATSAARSDTVLRWKLTAGQVLAYSAELKTVTTTNVNDFDTRGEQTLAVDGTWTVKAVAPDGSADVVQKLERIRLSMSIPGAGEVRYDSNEKKPAPGPLGAMLSPVLDAFLKGEVSLRLAPSGKVSEVKLSEDLAKAILANPEAEGVLDEETARRMAEAFPSLPEEPVKAGSAWERSTRVASRFGDLEAVEKTTYAGLERKAGRELHRLEIQSSYRLASGASKETAGVKLVPEETAGSATFEAPAGRFDEAVQARKFHFVIGGVSGRKSYDVTTETTLTTHLKN
jgi:hypothetical protein